MSEIKTLHIDTREYPINLANPGYPQSPYRLEEPIVSRTEPGVPQLLYLMGTYLNEPTTYNLAIIGSRQLEGELHQFTFHYIQEFLPLFFKAFKGDFGEMLSIISGMSLGADAWAQRLAIRDNVSTLGIAASSVNHAHHQSDTKVYQRLVQTPHDPQQPARGVISEYPPAVAPIKEKYYDRNRIVAWMSNSLLAYGIDRTTSGAMHTISLARHVNIPVFFLANTISQPVRRKLEAIGCIAIEGYDKTKDSVESFLQKINSQS